eukprot:TRINITY_DN78_c1_g1_i1.p1 TRINITY_DN78_c1_g1~~TRINITY_DN78_c1_g1_i1.p1  ORF type:complete len:183 (-),score=58.55 TRINITY_DN78_c1_g1_i1:311-859(-)
MNKILFFCIFVIFLGVVIAQGNTLGDFDPPSVFTTSTDTTNGSPESPDSPTSDSPESPTSPTSPVTSGSPITPGSPVATSNFPYQTYDIFGFSSRFYNQEVSPFYKISSFDISSLKIPDLRLSTFTVGPLSPWNGLFNDDDDDDDDDFNNYDDDDTGKSSSANMLSCAFALFLTIVAVMITI